jgi:ABC-type Na+ efflux pump permease subunit
MESKAFPIVVAVGLTILLAYAIYNAVYYSRVRRVNVDPTTINEATAAFWLSIIAILIILGIWIWALIEIFVDRRKKISTDLAMMSTY